MIAWADCITVTIARPRATAFPPILIYICAPFRRKRHGVEWLGPKVPVRHRNQLLSNVGSKFRLGRETIPPLFEGRHLGEAQLLCDLAKGFAKLRRLTLSEGASSKIAPLTVTCVS